MLKEVKAITHLRDFNTGGHRPMLILADDDNKYVVKPYKGTGFDYSFYNEILCNYLLGIWQLPTPKIALVKINKEIVANSNNGSGYKKSSFNNYFFGSLYQENALELNQYLTFNKQVDYKKIVAPEKIVDLGLFDIWVENDDRSPSNYNILLHSEKDRLKFLAIDNAFTFNTLDYKNLNPQFITNSFNDNVLYSELGKKILKKIKPTERWISYKKDLYYLCIRNCQQQFDEIINNIAIFYKLNDVDCEGLHSFLFDERRNKLVFQEFTTRLK